MNDVKIKAVELAIAASGPTHAYDAKALVNMARIIEAYISENVFVGTGTGTTYTVTGVQ
jgi:hypothetical protein